jgi:probable F420-dependent oxidoreductase
MGMRFGFGLITCQRYPGDPRSDTDLYREAVELSVEAERLGYDSVWTSEHHFVDDGYMPSVLPVSAAIAAATQRVEIGTGLLLAPLYEAIRLAEDAAVVDLLSQGRLLLGLGLGWRVEEFEALHVPMSERGRRMEDIITVLRQAWAGDLVTGGRLIAYPSVAVRPLPSRPGGPPLWIGGHAEAAIRRAGRLADGLLSNATSASSFARQIAWVREELEKSGRDPATFDFSIFLDTFAWEGGDAWERARDYIHYVSWKYDDMEPARSRREPPRLPPSLTPHEEERLRRESFVGRPEQVAEQIARLREVAGPDLHYVARMYWPGMDPGVQREAMAVFAEQVIPLLAAG